MATLLNVALPFFSIYFDAKKSKPYVQKTNLHAWKFQLGPCHAQYFTHNIVIK